MSMTHLSPLDGLRATAILIVFFAHCGLEKIIPGGFGVTVFFFLSGYLITSLLRSEVAQTGKIDLRGFYIRRTVRIWPSLYITMAFAALLTLLVPAGYAMQPLGVLAQLIFVTNYPIFGENVLGVPWIPLWSLAVEEHFYLFFPLLFATILIGKRPQTIALWCAIGCVAVLAFRIATALTIEDIDQIYYWSHTRIDSILFGCCLAMWQNPALDADAWKPKYGAAATALIVLLVCFVIRNEVFRQTLRYSLQGCALFVLFSYVISSGGWVAQILSSSVMRVIALYSYTLYLVHVPVIKAVKAFVPDISIIGLIVVAGALSIAYSAAMYSLVEAPAARWRRSLHKVDKNVTIGTG